MFVTFAVSYLFTWLAGCSVGPGISCGARKLARTPRVTKKKRELKNEKVIHNFIFLVFKSIMVHLNFVFLWENTFKILGCSS